MSALRNVVQSRGALVTSGSGFFCDKQILPDLPVLISILANFGETTVYKKIGVNCRSAAIIAVLRNIGTLREIPD
jgi:hypothetical protein